MFERRIYGSIKIHHSGRVMVGILQTNEKLTNESVGIAHSLSWRPVGTTVCIGS